MDEARKTHSWWPARLSEGTGTEKTNRQQRHKITKLSFPSLTCRIHYASKITVEIVSIIRSSPFLSNKKEKKNGNVILKIYAQVTKLENIAHMPRLLSFPSSFPFPCPSLDLHALHKYPLNAENSGGFSLIQKRGFVAVLTECFCGDVFYFWQFWYFFIDVQEMVSMTMVVHSKICVHVRFNQQQWVF